MAHVGHDDLAPPGTGILPLRCVETFRRLPSDSKSFDVADELARSLVEGRGSGDRWICLLLATCTLLPPPVYMLKCRPTIRMVYFSGAPGVQ